MQRTGWVPPGVNLIELATYSTTDTRRQTLPTSLARQLNVPIDSVNGHPNFPSCGH